MSSETGISGGALAGNVLCVANYPTNTGYAWTFIESLYAGIADSLAPEGVRTFVAYPVLEDPPKTLEHSAAQPVELPVDLGSRAALRPVLRFVRQQGVRAIYLTDRAVWHPTYVPLRAAGVRWIVVHDHTSGARDVPHGLKKTLKRLRQVVPGMLADRVIAVSDYVAQRKQDVDLVPPKRLVRIWNSLEQPGPHPGRQILSSRLGLEPARPWIACSCRASEPKGVPYLLRAFSRIWEQWTGPEPKPALLHIGDGPDLDSWRALGRGLPAAADIIFAGYREDAPELTGAVDVAVTPSVWAEAFGLASLEAMAYGVPVVASRVGGLPEIVRDGETGLLVPPRDENALVVALRRLLRDPDEARAMGQRGQVIAREVFGRQRQIASLVPVVRRGLLSGTAAR